MGTDSNLDDVWEGLSGAERALARHLLDAADLVGAAKAQRFLETEGLSVSQATVSRMLLKFDQLGITESVGRAGRRLTGRARLKLTRLSRHRKRNALIDGIFEETDRSELIDLLTVRKAIERQAVRIACDRSTLQDHAALLDSVQAYEEHSQCGGDFSSDAVEFHLRLCRATHSDSFGHIAEALYPEMSRLEPLLVTAARRANEPARSNEEHTDIVQALIQRDADAAERLTTAHFDTMIGWLAQLSETDFAALVVEMEA